MRPSLPTLLPLPLQAPSSGLGGALYGCFVSQRDPYDVASASEAIPPAELGPRRSARRAATPPGGGGPAGEPHEADAWAYSACGGHSETATQGSLFVGNSKTVLAALTEDVRSKYRPGPLLGKGAYGHVIGCVDLVTQQRYACKSVDVAALRGASDGPNIVRRLRNEIGVMSYLAGHPNIVRLQDGERVRANDRRTAPS